LNARAGSSLVADGDFGSKTKAAVKDFQRPRGLAVDGVIGQFTWGRLKQMADKLQIIDCVDVFDPSLNNLEAKDIVKAGGNPILIGGMSNGVEQAITEILGVASPGQVFLLRFHGHGNSGIAGISHGQGGFAGEHYSSIHTSNWAYMQPIISRLRPIFGPYGCIQFMHCSTGSGPNGRQILKNIATATGVPATAAVNTQFGGGLDTFRFEGATHTEFPGGDTLKSWCGALPDFIGMTVP
jgi:peptidoglycan hydrolase-like protein with peptidoglycan-binding domain